MNITKKLLLLLFVTGLVFTACKKNVSDDKDKTLNDTTATTSNDTSVSINLNSPVADEKILLRFQPVVGTTYIVESNVNSTMSEAQDTFKISYKSNKFGKVSLRILSKENTDYKMEFILKDVRETIKADTSTIEYKYGKALADPQADINRKIEDCLVNSPLTIMMSGAGEATDIRGYEGIIAKVKAIVGQNIDDNMIAAQLGTPTETLENYFINYPDSAVKIGESWDLTVASQMQGVPIVLINTYTLADRKNGVAFINFRTDIEIDKSQIPAEVAAQMSNIKFDAYIKGTGEVDEKTGWPKVIKVTQSVELSDSFEGHVTSSKQYSTSVIKWVQ
ncbi:MAG: hypothetical protein KAX72_11045 [Chitinophagales bacterium]|jgi:hypothetical protein|nr:hypothetical protein [Bacteroidota bacterium]MBP8250631.1 hypothetical protein [Chitinophagales bacterium]